jgi:hypothetical protein
VHDTAQIGIRGSIEARPEFFESPRQATRRFRVHTREAILRAVGDRFSDDTLQGIEISASSIRRVIAPKRRPGPKRDTWSKFMRNKAASIIACDLFTVETVRMKTLHVLFFIDLNTRRVSLRGVTDSATNVRWCTQIARNHDLN